MPELVSEWVDGIRDGIENTRSTFSLSEFLMKNNIPIDRITKRYMDLSINPQRKIIKRFIHSSGRPYIPGSSLKGAIRTAFVYQLLQTTENGKNFVKDLIANLQKNIPDKKKHKKIINNDFKKKLARLLDRSPHTDPFKDFLVSDSRFFALEDIEIAPVSRYHLKRLKEDSPSYREIIRPGAITEITLQTKNKSIEANKFWKAINDWEEICSYLNAFSADSLHYELQSLPEPFFSTIADFYKKLAAQIDNLKKGEAILRIGAGKTFFDNTIDLIFSKSSNEFYRLRELFGIGRNPSVKGDQKLPKKFPISRFFIGRNKKPIQPLGWIKLSREDI